MVVEPNGKDWEEDFDHLSPAVKPKGQKKPKVKRLSRLELVVDYIKAMEGTEKVSDIAKSVDKVFTSQGGVCKENVKKTAATIKSVVAVLSRFNAVKEEGEEVSLNSE